MSVKFNFMDQELKAITEFLMCRARKHIEQFTDIGKIYFIMRYPSKPKLVYSPVNTGPFLQPILFMLLPMRVHSQWAIRKPDCEPGTELVALFSAMSCEYKPRDPNTDLMHRAGDNLLVYGIHTKDSITIFQQFYVKSGDTIVWEPVEEVTNMAPKGPAAHLFPKDM